MPPIFIKIKTMEYKIILLIGLIHYVADFWCQSRWMAENKSKDVNALAMHVAAYSIVTTTGWWLMLGSLYPEILFLTFMTHFVTDLITSKLTTYYYKKENWYMFFNVVGLDQLIHLITLILTYKLVCS